MRRRARFALGSALFAVAVLYFLGFGVLRPLLRPYAYSDFATFYAASRAVASAENPYQREVLVRELLPEWSGWVGQYFYPPPFAAVIVRPLLVLPFATARRVWVLIETAALVAAGIVLATLGGAHPVTWMTVALVLLPFAPCHDDVKLGSVSGILLLLFALFLRARARRQDNRAALALAASIGLKLVPAVVLVYLGLRGERRLAARTLLACVLLVVLGLPWTGWRLYFDYAHDALPHLRHGVFAWFTNQSLDAFFARILLQNPDTTPWIVSPLLHRGLTVLASAGILTLLARSARRAAAPHADAAWGPSLALLAGLLVARITWESMVVLSLPCFCLAAQAFRAGEMRQRHALAFVTAYALCALPFPYAQQPVRAGIGLLLESPRLYGMLILFASGIAHLCDRRRV